MCDKTEPCYSTVLAAYRGDPTKETCLWCGSPMVRQTGRMVAKTKPRETWACADKACGLVSILSPHDGQWHWSDVHMRAARHYAHEVFDLLWLEGHMDTMLAYHWLAHRMCIVAKDDCHLSHFDIPTCQRVERYAAEKLADVRRNPLKPRMPKPEAVAPHARLPLTKHGRSTSRKARLARQAKRQQLDTDDGGDEG